MMAGPKRNSLHDGLEEQKAGSRLRGRKRLRCLLSEQKRLLFRDEFGLRQGIHKTPEERSDHLNAISEFIQDKENWELHSWLHENLIILDNKASATLAVNSIVLAGFTIFYSTLDAKTLVAVKFALLAAILLLAWSMVPLAQIIYVYWSTTEDFHNPEQMLCELLNVRDRRSLIIRKSTIKGVIAIVIVALTLTINLLAILI